MTRNQVDTIVKKINFNITQLDNMLRKEPEKRKFIEFEITNWEEHIPIIKMWYRTHPETPITDREGEEGYEWLLEQRLETSGDVLYSDVLDWFIESYGIGLPQEQYTYQKSQNVKTRKAVDELYDILQRVDANVKASKQNGKQYE